MDNRGAVAVLVLVALICAVGGFLGGRLSAPPQTVLQMPAAVPPPAPPVAAPQQSALGAAIAALGSCVDVGESLLGAPHSCRWADGQPVGAMVHWWGPQHAPSRAYVAFSVASVTRENVEAALDAMIGLALAFTNAFHPPEGFFSRITVASPEASFRAAGLTVTAREHRMLSHLPPQMITVDVTVGD